MDDHHEKEAGLRRRLRSRRERVGLCADCRHLAPVPGPRSLFVRCRLAAGDARFARYPILPVLECPGFEPVQ